MSEQGKTFYLVNNNPKNGFIMCKLHVPNPSCSDFFEWSDDAIAVNISYDYDDLAQWQSLRKKTSDLIAKFSAPTSEK